MGRTLITVGVILVIAGLLWPWLLKAGLGSLPGDIRIERKDYVFYFPLTSGLLVSVLISLVLWILRR